MSRLTFEISGVKKLLKERELDSFLRILNKEEELLVRLPEQQNSVL